MNEYLLNNKITVLTNATRDILLEKNPDALILYLFYIKTANHQETNQVWANDFFVRQGLKWGKQKLQKAKETLVEEDLIEEIQTRGDKGIFEKKFLKIKYLWSETKKTAVNQHLIREHQNPLADDTTGGFQETNALSSYKLNALSSNKQMLEIDIYEKTNSKKIKKQKRLLTEEDIYQLENLDEKFVKKIVSNFEITEEELKHFAKNTFIPSCQASARKYADFFSALQNWIAGKYARKLSEIEKLRKQKAQIEKDYPGIVFIGGEFDGI